MLALTWMSSPLETLRFGAIAWTGYHPHRSRYWPLQNAWWQHTTNWQQTWCLQQFWIRSATVMSVYTEPIRHLIVCTSLARRHSLAGAFATRRVAWENTRMKHRMGAHQWDRENNARFTTAGWAHRMEVVRSAETHPPDSLTTACMADMAMIFVLDPAKTSNRSFEWPDWTSLRNLRVEEPEMESLPVPRNHMQPNAALEDRSDEPEPAVTTVSHADVNNVDRLGFDKTCVIALFQRKHYKVYGSFWFMSCTPRPTSSVLYTSTGPNLVHKSFLPVE